MVDLDHEEPIHRASSFPDITSSSGDAIQYPVDKSLPVYVDESQYLMAGGILLLQYFTILGTLDTSVTPSSVHSIVSERTLQFDFVTLKLSTFHHKSVACVQEMPNTKGVYDWAFFANPYRYNKIPYFSTDTHVNTLMGYKVPYKSIFMIVPFGIQFAPGAGHQNALVMIFDPLSDVVKVERFEPHGTWAQHYPKSEEKDIGISVTLFDRLLKKAFAKPQEKVSTQNREGQEVDIDVSDINILCISFEIHVRRFHLKFEYVGLQTDLCPRAFMGPQSKQRNFNGELGLCVVWSALYMDLRVRNPTRESGEIIKSLLEMDPVQLLQMVQKFAMYMEIVVKKYSARTCRVLETFTLLDEIYLKVSKASNAPRIEPAQKLVEGIRSSDLSLENLGKILQLFSVAIMPDFDEYLNPIANSGTVKDLLEIADNVPVSIRPPLCPEGTERVVPLSQPSLISRILGFVGMNSPPKSTCEPKCERNEARNQITGKCMDLRDMIKEAQKVNERKRPTPPE